MLAAEESADGRVLVGGQGLELPRLAHPAGARRIIGGYVKKAYQRLLSDWCDWAYWQGHADYLASKYALRGIYSDRDTSIE